MKTRIGTRRVAALILISFLCARTAAAATTGNWIGPSGDDFTTPNDWDIGSVPTGDAKIGNGATVLIALPDSIAIQIGIDVRNSSSITQIGGMLSASGLAIQGALPGAGGAGAYNLQGGVLDANVDFAPGSNASLSVSGGTLNGNLSLDGRLGILTQTGGTINAAAIRVSAADNYSVSNSYRVSAGATNFTGGRFDAEGTLSATGTGQLSGATLDVGRYSPSLMNLTASASVAVSTIVFGSQDSGTTVSGVSSRGYLVQTGGSLQSADVWIAGDQYAGSGIGIYAVSGGSLNVTNNLNIGAGAGSTSVGGELNVSGLASATVAGATAVGQSNVFGQHPIGILDVTGGFFQTSALTVGFGTVGTLNIRGGKLIATQAVSLGATYFSDMSEFEAIGTGIVNLDGGVLSAPSIGPGFNLRTAPTSLLNFNGGTLQARGDSANFVEGLTSVYVYPGGGTIDTNGHNITIAQELRAPRGNGVASVAIVNGGSGYLAPPIVTVTGAGVGASAVATIDPTTGALTGIVVTNPGVDYNAGASIALIGGDPSTAATLGTPAVSPNSSGGLTVLGGGSLTLTANNTFSGSTSIGTGTTLQLGNGGATGSVNSTAAISNNGVLIVNRSTALTLGGDITGTGQLQQSGSGTTTLLGNNSYSGGTTINAGTLQIGNGGTTGVLPGGRPITDNGALVFDRSDSIFVGDKVTGNGSLQNTGTGTTVLSGASTYAGNTTVSAGTIYVTGSLTNNGSDKVLVNAGTDFSTASIIRRVQPGGRYSGMGSAAAGGAVGLVASHADIRAGQNDGSTLLADLAMQWRVRTAAESGILSDVINLSGMSPPGVQTDPFALQMTYDATAMGAATEDELALRGSIYLAWLVPGSSQQSGGWYNAIAGNFGTTTFGELFHNVQLSWDDFAAANSITDANVGNFLGSYGVDVADHQVWAVVNHNSQFATLPEPASWELLAAGAMLLAALRGAAWRTTRV